MDGPYKPDMKFKSEWSQGKKAAHLAARKRYHHTGTKETLADKVSGMKAVLKRWKAADVNEDKIGELTTAIERWEAKGTKNETQRGSGE